MAQGVGAEVDVAIVYSKWGRLVTRAGVWVESETPADPCSVTTRSPTCSGRSTSWPREVSCSAADGLTLWVGLTTASAHRGRRSAYPAAHGGREDPIRCLRAPPVLVPTAPRFVVSEDRGAFVAACVRDYRMVETFWRQREELSPSRRAGFAENFHTAARYYAEHDGATFAVLVCHSRRSCPRLCRRRLVRCGNFRV